jgi:hypothetical protein
MFEFDELSRDDLSLLSPWENKNYSLNHAMLFVEGCEKKITSLFMWEELREACVMKVLR